MSVYRNDELIIDIGVSEGNDTDFYIKKGFKVVGIEADKYEFERLMSRFNSQIDDLQCLLINKAAAYESGQTVQFLVSSLSQGHSRVVSDPANSQGELTEIETINWPDIIRLKGIPYYCKVDIEGQEGPFLRSITKEIAPKFISVECHIFEPIQRLIEIGYREFKFLHQNAHNAFTAPNPPLEGNYLPGHVFSHASGYFGEELSGRWLNIKEVVTAFSAVDTARALGALPHLWFDCHAKLY